MFADMELIGIPHRVTVGDRGLKEGALEYQLRAEGKVERLPLADAVTELRRRLC